MWPCTKAASFVGGACVNLFLKPPHPVFHRTCPSLSCTRPESLALLPIFAYTSTSSSPMSLDYPEFLARNPPAALQEQPSRSGEIPSQNRTEYAEFAPARRPSNPQWSDTARNGDFDDLLRNKLSALEHQDRSPMSGPADFQYNNFYQQNFDAFNLPRELQGGIGNISSRRPSYAAELFTRSQQPFSMPQNSNKNSLATFAAANNFLLSQQQPYGLDQLLDSLGQFSLNGYSDFQARRPSQLADFPPVPQYNYQPLYAVNNYGQNLPNFSSSPLSQPSAGPTMPGQTMKLDNGLLLKDQYILASAELKTLYSLVTAYFQDVDVSNDILTKLKELLANEVVLKLITFIKNLNNLTFNHKMLCLVVNKNGKLDLLSYPNNSNIFLQHDDLVIVDGDRGKDLVMILDPLVNLNFAILFNFLKKIEHLKSLTINDANGGSSVKSNHTGGTHSTSLNASSIINSHSNEDNEFIITLPTKQVLRFATPKEVQKLSGKFLEEKKAFVTCFNKIKELGLSNNLTLINVEYQCDFKKLIFYYFANFKRIDFRGLIKELFKIYKTRIWLCAVLPYDRPEMYTSVRGSSKKDAKAGIPREYELSNEQIMSFSINEFERLPRSTYFHLRNMLNLITNLTTDVKGNFYGFSHLPNEAFKAPQTAGIFDNPALKDYGLTPQKSYPIHPSFNPFGDDKKL